MTNDKQVEVWRAEFERWFNGKTKNNGGVAYYVGAEGKYCFTDIELAWQSWLAAKRSQPSVVLPKPEVCFGKTPFAYVLLDSLCDNLTAAGIKYTIGE